MRKKYTELIRIVNTKNFENIKTVYDLFEIVVVLNTYIFSYSSIFHASLSLFMKGWIVLQTKFELRRRLVAEVWGFRSGFLLARSKKLYITSSMFFDAL